ncbi:MAG: pyridoxamine 5'-phosphate oxidase [Deltaproteobacteria bacterium]|nr:MAG: pyridoxamine 5'-phosphate oxidase [Deltaproteobacteria bacterium]
MSRTEREAFLAGTHVAIVSVVDDGRGPLTVPVWYRYEPGGEVRFVTGRTSRKLDLIKKAGRLSLCVQTETAPYEYVTVEGPATVGEPDYERDIRGVAIRYLGDRLGETYLAMTAEQRVAEGEVLVSVHPERWLTADFHKMTP